MAYAARQALTTPAAGQPGTQSSNGRVPCQCSWVGRRGMGAHGIVKLPHHGDCAHRYLRAGTSRWKSALTLQVQ